MSTRPAGVPPTAEELSLVEFFKGYDTPSKLLPGLTQRRYRLRCPKCSAEQPDRIDALRCECGLSMQIGAGTLYVWNEKVPA